jgi:hypothetical protein
VGHNAIGKRDRERERRNEMFFLVRKEGLDMVNV